MLTSRMVRSQRSFCPVIFNHYLESHVSLPENFNGDSMTVHFVHTKNDMSGARAWHKWHLCQSGHARDLYYFIAGLVPRHVPPDPKGALFPGSAKYSRFRSLLNNHIFPEKCCIYPATWNRSQGHWCPFDPQGGCHLLLQRHDSWRRLSCRLCAGWLVYGWYS
jgi:hypothetical protein